MPITRLQRALYAHCENQDHFEDIQRLKRAIPDLRGLTEAAIEKLYADYSESFFAAGWVGVSDEDILRLRVWLNEDVPGEPVKKRPVDGWWPEHCEQRAFVSGAKWWQFHKNGATAFGSERDEMEEEAVRRYGEPEGKPDPEDVS